MRKFLLPLLSMVMVFVLSCTSDLKMISEDDLSTPIITSELADVAFATNFTIRSSGSTSFIIDPGTKSITRYNFSVSFDDSNYTDDGNAYLSAVVSESTYTNGYQIYFSPSQYAVDLVGRTTVKCYLTITYDDVKTVEYSLNVVLNEDAPSFATQPVGDTLTQNFTTEDFAYITFELDPGIFAIDTADITVTGLESRMLTQYSVTHLGESNADSVNWYTIVLQPSRKAVLLSDESTVTAAIQILYQDDENTTYSISSYSFDVLLEADCTYPEFLGGMSDVVFVEDYTTSDYVDLLIYFDQGSSTTGIYNAQIDVLDEFGVSMEAYATDNSNNPMLLPDVTNPISRSTSGTKVTTYARFTPQASARDNAVLANGYNGKIIVYLWDAYEVKDDDAPFTYYYRETNLIMPAYNGTTPPVITGTPGTIILQSDFQLGAQGYESEQTGVATTTTFTENTYTLTLNKSIWDGLITEADMFIEYVGEGAEWMDASLTTFTWTTNTVTPTVTFTVQPTQAGIDYYLNNYLTQQDYIDYPMDTGAVYAYVKLGYNKNSEGVAQDTTMFADPIPIQFLPPTPEGLISTDWSYHYGVFIAPEDEVDDDGNFLFTWDEAVAKCASKERHPLLPWDWYLPDNTIMKYINQRRYHTDFYDYDTSTCSLSLVGAYWTTLAYGENMYYVNRCADDTAYPKNVELSFNVRCVVDKYQRGYSEIPDVEM